MTCVAAWLQTALSANDGAQRMVVMDESWRMFSHLAIAAWMQQSFKLSRASGTMNVLVMHHLKLSSFGRPGSDRGEFSLPHGVCFLGSDRLVVCDRENFRLQVFTLDGEPLEQWHHYYPQAVRSVCGPDGHWHLFVGEGPPVRYQRHTPNLGCRVKVLDAGGDEVGRAGAGGWGFEDDHFTCIHGLAVDSRGDLYVAECPYMTITRYYEEEAPPGELLSLRKWRRRSAG